MEALGIFFFLISYLTGYVLTVRFLPDFTGLLRISASIVLGIFLSVWVVLILSVFFNNITPHALETGLISTTILLLIFTSSQWKLFRAPHGIKWQHPVFFSIIFTFSLLLFYSIFKYHDASQSILIDRFIWSDFGFHIPLIRSFSLGSNLSFENPLYAHEILRYHFMFDFMVGALERSGLRIDHALNIPSALFSTSLVILIYYLGKALFFGSRFVGALSALLFVFNSSLTYLEFFKKHSPDSFKQTITTWWEMRDYVAFGPWDGNLITAFWSWNIYINQRQLIVGFAVIAIVLIHLIQEHFPKNKAVKPTYAQKAFLGAVVGLLVFWHGASFLCLFGFLGLFFLLFPNRRASAVSIITAFIFAVPLIFWLQQSSPNVHGESGIYLGYLVNNYLITTDIFSNQTLNAWLGYTISFFRFWFFNLGLSLITVPLAFFLVDSRRKLVFLIFFSIFVFGNVVKLSPDIGVNHKFFNLGIILANTFTAYLLFRLFKFNWFGRILTAILVFFLTISGVIDFTPIKNDFYVSFEDYKTQPLTKWVYENTPPDSVFLTTYRIYNPVSFAGRKSIQGWPYFAWGAGYDTESRKRLAKEIYSADSKDELCALLRDNGIDYVMTETETDDNKEFKFNHDFFNGNFEAAFYNSESRHKERIFVVDAMCPLSP